MLWQTINDQCDGSKSMPYFVKTENQCPPGGTPVPPPGGTPVPPPGGTPVPPFPGGTPVPPPQEAHLPHKGGTSATICSRHLDY